MLSDTIRQQLATLESLWPEYQIWCVPVVIGPDTWCARLRGSETGGALNAASPEELSEHIENHMNSRG